MPHLYSKPFVLCLSFSLSLPSYLLAFNSAYAGGNQSKSSSAPESKKKKEEEKKKKEEEKVRKKEKIRKKKELGEWKKQVGSTRPDSRFDVLPREVKEMTMKYIQSTPGQVFWSFAARGDNPPFTPKDTQSYDFSKFKSSSFVRLQSQGDLITAQKNDGEIEVIHPDGKSIGKFTLPPKTVPVTSLTDPQSRNIFVFSKPQGQEEISLSVFQTNVEGTETKQVVLQQALIGNIQNTPSLSPKIDVKANKVLISTQRGNQPNQIEVWDTDFLTRPHILKPNQGSFTYMGFSQNGQFIIGVAEDQSTYVFDSENGKLLHKIDPNRIHPRQNYVPIQTRRVVMADASAGPPFLVVKALESGQVLIADLSKPQNQFIWEGISAHPESAQERPNVMSFDYSGNFLLTASGKKLRLWHRSPRAKLAEWTFNNVITDVNMETALGRIKVKTTNKENLTLNELEIQIPPIEISAQYPENKFAGAQLLEKSYQRWKKGKSPKVTPEETKCFQEADQKGIEQFVKDFKPIMDSLELERFEAFKHEMDRKQL